MSRRTFVVLGIGASASALACAVAMRVTPDAGRCSRGFVADGPRCILATPCPYPYVASKEGCSAPNRRIAIPGGPIVLHGTDWEAEGRVDGPSGFVADFELDAYEVTRGEYEGASVTDATARLTAKSGVTRAEAHAFCRARGGHLPTYAEWVFAAAGPRGRRYPWGDTGAVCRRAAFGLEKGPCATSGTGPDPVGSHEAGMSELGLHDMAGNVAEWVDAKEGFVLGGSYRTSLATDLRTWRKDIAAPELRHPHVGFRCAYTASDLPAKETLDRASDGGAEAKGSVEPRDAGHDSGALRFFPAVEGANVPSASIDQQPVFPVGDVAVTPLPKGKHSLTFHAKLDADGAIEVPVCAGRTRVLVDGAPIPAAGSAPLVAEVKAGPHDVSLELDVGRYEARIACSGPIRVGRSVRATSGFAELTFPSPEKEGGKAIVYLPKKSISTPSPLLVGLHPWDSTVWTYAAYSRLLRAADALGVVLLFPSGLGNSLYTKRAEDEVLRAVATAKSTLPVREDRVSIFGASMGGAGATTIAFHHPDAFVFVGSLFGDSKYDLATYVRSILKDEKGAHLVSALDYAENGEHFATWLVHGDADKVSPVKQSDLLAEKLRTLGYAVTYHRVPNRGHEGLLVEEYAAEIVERAASAQRKTPTHLRYRSVDPAYDTAFGVTLVRSGPGDAVVELEKKGGHTTILLRKNVTRVELAKDGPFAGELVEPKEGAR